MKTKIKKLLQNKIFKEVILIAIIVLISGLVELKIYRNIPQIQTTNDTISYEEVNLDLIHGVVDDTRTPVYPLVLKVFRKIFGKELYFAHVVRFQKILFLIGLVLLYLMTKKITNNKIIASVVSFAYGMSPLLFFWNTFILTESIATFEVILLAFLTINYLKKPKLYLGILMMAMVFISIMTRPSFIYLLPIYILFWAVRFFTNKEEKKQVITGLISSLIVVILILGYCGLIKKNYGNFSLTGVSNLNNTLTAIDSRLYRKCGNDQIIKTIDDIVGDSKDEAYCWEANAVVSNKYSDEEIEDLINKSLKGMDYYIFILAKCLDNASSQLTVSYVSDTMIYTNLSSILTPFTFGVTYIIVFCAIIYLIVNLIKNKKIDWIIAFFTAIIFSNTFVLMVGAPFEERRLALPSIPMIYLLIAFVIGVIINKFKEDKNNKKNSNKSIKDLIKKENWFYKLFIEKTDDTKIQFLRYIFVGGVAAVVNIVAFTVLNRIMDYRIANVIAFSLGLLTNYLLSKKLVFAKEKSLNKYAEFIIYAIIGVLGLLWDTLIIGLCMNKLEIMDFISKIISTGIVFIWNFGARKIMYILINKFIISKKEKDEKEEK